MRAPQPGDRLGGYVIESVLGQGAMGIVHLATHERLERKVALKTIAPHLADDESYRRRFLRESRLAASIDHPSVIPVYDAGEDGGHVYLAMRYVAGPSLQAVVRERGPLGPSDTLLLLEQIGGALDAAHAAGLVHRDVKPANILLAGDGTGHRAYLTDFGLAKAATSESVTRIGSFVGTVDFASPEQIEGRTLDGRSDLYSLGCVAVYCLTGAPPFRRESEPAVMQAHLTAPPPSLAARDPELPAALDAVVATALAKDPAARYPTGAALVAAFAAAVAQRGADDSPTRAAPPPALALEAKTVVRPLQVDGRRRILVATAAVGIVVAAVVVAVLALNGGGQKGVQKPPPAKTKPVLGLRALTGRVNAGLTKSASERSTVNGTLSRAFNCSLAPAAAAGRIAQVIKARRAIVASLAAFTAADRQSANAVRLLRSALQLSIEADTHYRAAFASLPPPGAKCSIARTGQFALAAHSDIEASVAKAKFVAAYSPLATRAGRRTWTANDF